ncbi:helix-turn-helix domain-containing protein [Fodinicurvata halophila]|uniref:Helix-turn-helix domain-containing protein n=1 Tax=Fodinicurvata halophila TaxID=1419723 RepID=A0ABV8UND0_9PROT
MYHKTDIHIGHRLRERRVALGLSQSELADKLGVSFQQVQKYESGANRISGSRLWDISTALETPVSYFFEGLDSEGFGSDETPLDRQTLELARAVGSIEDENVRSQIVKLVKAFAKAG